MGALKQISIAVILKDRLRRRNLFRLILKRRRSRSYELKLRFQNRVGELLSFFNLQQKYRLLLINIANLIT